jgi:tripeptidyl-peptidase II
MHNGRSFKVDVDPTNLEPGVHTAKVVGYDAGSEDSGIKFSLPITVVKNLPEAMAISLGVLDFAPTEVKRNFVTVPHGATWMDVTVTDKRDDDDASARLVVLHTVQLLPHAAYRDAESQKHFNMLPGETKVVSIRVYAGVTCEVALARYWSAMGSTRMEVSLQFRGIRPLPDQVHLTAGSGGTCIRVFSDLKDEVVSPSAKLLKWKCPVRPKSEGVITPLGERDVIPGTNKRIYQLLLHYEFTQEEAGSFTPRSPALQSVLYESAYISQMMMIYDGDKKFLGVGDSWPKDVKTPKGTMTIRLQIRHDSPAMLEKLKDVTIWIERKLDKEISLAAYTTKEAMMSGTNAFRKRVLRKGTSTSIYFADPPASKLPKQCNPGDILFGTATYENGENSLPGDGKRPGGFAVTYVVGPKPPKNSTEATTPEVPDERTVEEKMAEAVRDIKVGQLGKLTDKEKEAGKYDALYTALATEYPGHLPLLLAAIVEAADKIIKEISQDELAKHFGLNHDKEDPKAVKERKEMDKKKTSLIEALARKARAFGDIPENGADFDSTLKELQKWIDIDSNKKYAVLVLAREKKAGRFGSMLKLLNALLKDNGDSTKGGICPLTKADILGKRADVLESLGFSKLVEYDKKWRVISSPNAFGLF